ncbi:PAS domain-containing protein [Curvivirga sp.]|uniref:PAS domain-containing protein n=1 Tax=Curvivirga sp. TaxID=2856848 RepID=UPI003B599D0A
MIGEAKNTPPFETHNETNYTMTRETQQDFDRYFGPQAEDFNATQTRELFDWYSKYQPKFPQRKDFDIIQHWGLAPYLYLIEIQNDGTFHYRLNGEQVVEILGHNQRGLKLGQKNDMPVNAAFASYMRKLVDQKTTARCMGDLSLLDRSYIKFESFDCPLVDKTGQISHIIGVICLLK